MVAKLLFFIADALDFLHPHYVAWEVYQMAGRVVIRKHEGD